MDKEDQAKIKRLLASVRARSLVAKNGDVDNAPISPEEGLDLVQAFVSIRSPTVRAIILNLIKELAKETN